MSNPNDNHDEQSFDDAFDEFAGEGAESGSAAAADDAGDGDHGADDRDGDELEQPRDDQGRFTTDDEGDEADPLAELERYKQEAQQWQHRYNSDLGRQTALQRKIQEQQQLIESLQRQAPAQRQGNPEAGDNPDGSGYTDAEWDELKEDFPEFAKAVEAKLSGLSRQYEQQIQALQGQLQPIQQQAHQQFIQSQYAALEQKHPDWRDVAQSNAFQGWLNQQPVNVQRMIDSDDAADAAWLLDNYKLTTGAQSPGNDLRQRRERQMQQARTIPNRGGRGRSNLPPEDDFGAAFDYFASQG